MARQAAKSLLLKIEDPPASSTFVTLGMLQNADFAETRNAIDVTNKDSPDDQREQETGIKSFSASGRGFFDAGQGWNRLRQDQQAGTKPKMQVIVPGEGTYEGIWIVTTRGMSGGQEGSVEGSLSIESAGEITFT